MKIKRMLSYAILILFVISCICFARLLIYMFTDKTEWLMIEKRTVWDATTTQKIVDLPDTSYNCKIMIAVIGDNINFCKLTSDRPILNGVPMVMGDFNSQTNRIRITKETSNDAIVHEFIHYAISCEKKTKDNELCVRSVQKMLLELNLIK